MIKKKLFEPIFLILWGKIEGYIYNYYYYVVDLLKLKGYIVINILFVSKLMTIYFWLNHEWGSREMEYIKY